MTYVISYHHLAFNAYSLCYFFNYSFTTLTWNLAIWQSGNLAIRGNPGNPQSGNPWQSCGNLIHGNHPGQANMHHSRNHPIYGVR